MNLMTLKKNLSDKNLSNLYVFVGDEIAVRNIYIDKIKALFGKDTVYADSVSSITGKLKTNNLFGSKQSLFIVYDDKDITNSKIGEKVWASLKDGTFQKNHIIILVYNNIDKKEKFYKEFSDYIVSFDLLSTDVLLKYTLKEIDLPKDKAEYLIGICSNNYNIILMETDKLRCLAEYNHITHEQAFDMCVEQNSFYMPTEGGIFDLLNSILNRNIVQTYEDFQMFVRRGDSPIAILSLLHSNLKAILQLQCADGLKDIGKVTGLTGYQIKSAQQFMYRYSNEELIRMIKIVRFCEKSIKQTGVLNTDNVMDFIFIKIF